MLIDVAIDGYRKVERRAAFGASRSSRDIEAVYRHHVTFIALSGDTQPHFTTIAGFVSRLADDIARVFTQVLYLCDRQGLIGREMFAIDGVKLPSNASKQKSGTRDSGNGSPITRMIVKAVKAQSERATAPITSRPRWRPAKA